MAAGFRPVAVAANGVDFAVVRQIAERLRQPPLRQGVGGKALMKQTDRGFEFGIVEVGVEHRQVGRHHQPFVADDPSRQGKHVVDRIALANMQVSAAAGDEQLAFKRLGGYSGGRGDKDLFDVRQGLA